MSASEEIGSILASMRRIAVVGLSPSPDRPSHEVASYLKRQGYTIVPVNPGEEAILGEKAYPDLRSIPGDLDVVDVFRRAEAVMPIAEEAVRRGGIKVFWMQLGVRNEEAARLLQQHGIAVIQDRCLKIEHESRRSR